MIFLSQKDNYFGKIVGNFHASGSLLSTEVVFPKQSEMLWKTSEITKKTRRSK